MAILPDLPRRSFAPTSPARYQARALLEILTLGNLELARNGQRLPLPPSKKTRALLGYLVATGREHRRDRLCALFWDVTEDPRGALRWSMSKLRAVLDDQAARRLSTDRDRISFEPHGARVDLHAVESAVAGDLSQTDVEALEQALAQFRGELLEDCDLPDFHDFQAWLIAERARVRLLRCALARTLTQRLASQPQRALPHARTWAALEPVSAAARSTLVRVLYAAGHPREAHQQYDLSLRLLREQGAPALTLLHEARKSGENSVPAESAPPAPSTQPRARAQQLRFCSTRDGVQLAYATVGQGPPIVKTGNWISHLEYEWNSPVWRHVITELSSYRTLVRYDQRGNGMSDWQVPDFTFESMVDDLATVIDAAGLERFALFGLSQGCAVSVAYAARHPERVTQLVLHGGYVCGWHSWSETSRTEGEAMLTLMEAGWGRPNPAFRQLFTSRFLPDATLEQIQWFNELQRVSSNAENAVRLMRALGTVDIRHLLSQVRAPTLVTLAEGDAFGVQSQAKKLAAGIPGARFVSLQSKNHLMLEHEPAWQIFRETVREFLDSYTE